MTAPNASEPANAPRTYRVAAGWRVFLTLAGLAFSIGGLFCSWFAWNTHSEEATFFWRIVAAVGSLVWGVGVGLYGIVAASRNHLVLTADRIIVYQLLYGRQSLRRDEIAGRRRKMHYTLLVPTRPGLDAVRVDSGYATDSAFDAWLASIPTLDAANS